MPRTKVIKSEVIRKYLAENHGAMPKDVIAALAKKRIRVSSQMVSIVRRKLADAKKNGHVSFDQLVAAKLFVKRVGSLSEARRAVSALATLL